MSASSVTWAVVAVRRKLPVCFKLAERHFMQPTMGKLATLFGPRRIFLVGALILLFVLDRLGIQGQAALAIWTAVLAA